MFLNPTHLGVSLSLHICIWRYTVYTVYPLTLSNGLRSFHLCFLAISLSHLSVYITNSTAATTMETHTASMGVTVLPVAGMGVTASTSRALSGQMVPWSSTPTFPPRRSQAITGLCCGPSAFSYKLLSNCGALHHSTQAITCSTLTPRSLLNCWLRCLHTIMGNYCNCLFIYIFCFSGLLSTILFHHPVSYSLRSLLYLQVDNRPCSRLPSTCFQFATEAANFLRMLMTLEHTTYPRLPEIQAVIAVRGVREELGEREKYTVGENTNSMPFIFWCSRDCFSSSVSYVAI